MGSTGSISWAIQCLKSTQLYFRTFTPWNRLCLLKNYEIFVKKIHALQPVCLYTLKYFFRESTSKLERKIVSLNLATHSFVGY